MSKSLEERMEEKIEQEASAYFKKYKNQMEALEGSPLGKVRSIGLFDYWSLGKQLAQWDELLEFAEADGTVGDLGALPKIAYDVITVVYGTSPLSICATVQPIDEEQGIVYFKQVQAVNAAGNMGAGEAFVNAEEGFKKIPAGVSGAEQVEVVDNGDGSTKTFTKAKNDIPVRPFTVSVVAGAIVGQDDGNGNIVGSGISGTINYVTGALSVTFATAPANNADITFTYSVNQEAETQINTINYELTTKSIRAKVYSLRGTVGMLKSFALRKRFGMVAEDELATDLTQMINEEMFGVLLAKMKSAAMGTTTWYKKQPYGVSYFEHKQSVKDALAGCESVIVKNAGRGTASFIIAGLNQCTLLSTLPGFVKVYDGKSVSGAHLYGTLDGAPVIRVPLATQMAANAGVVGYKGASVFEAPAVYSPYMPLTVTSMLPTVNPLVQQRAAAVGWS